MKSIRRIGMGAAGIAAISTAVALTAPLAAADTVGQGDALEFVTANDCPPSPTPTPSTSGTGSSLTPLTTIINSLLKGLGAAGGGTSTSTGSASSVG
ncbi:hypothetical protein ACWDUL_06495 [Nocardia niigatensis]|uniref:hypothetical protein n=1 Tax=Nocardia niigatensis TaxID=209249 RepID=UPI0002F97054|nr:hypothetical protein [Nocardia niigatensis]